LLLARRAKEIRVRLKRAGLRAYALRQPMLALALALKQT
jgi:hypothetical protein